MTTNQLITKIGRQRVLTALSNVVCSSSGGIDDSITDGVTDRAPSQNAVFDALALKQDAYSNFYIVSTISALQTYLAGLGAGVDVNIWFPAGSYTATSAITISNKGAVRIFGEGATIVDGRSTSGDVFDIDNITSLHVRGLTLDHNLNANSNSDLFDVNTVTPGTVKFESCNFKNFNTENDYGIRFTTSGGVLIPGILITGCNFSNAFSDATTFNYSSNVAKGIGIYFAASSEYWKVSECNFYSLNIAVWGTGANGSIEQCNFIACNPVLAGPVYRGVVYSENGSSNYRKLGIYNSKFNHNWGYCFYSDSNNSSPNIVQGCYFIANVVAPIYFTGSGNNHVQNNHIVTTGTSLASTTNAPAAFVAAETCHIKLVNSNATFIQGNLLGTPSLSQPGIVSTGTSEYQIIKDNVYQSGMTLSSLVGSSNIITRNTSTLGVDDGSATVANPYAFVSRAAAQSISDNTITAVSFDTETTDVSGIYSSGNPTRLTIPGSGNKLATVSVMVNWAVNSTGIRRTFIYKNGNLDQNGYDQGPSVSTVDTAIQSTFQIEVVGGDYLEIRVYQNSTGSLNVSSCKVAIKVEGRL